MKLYKLIFLWTSGLIASSFLLFSLAGKANLVKADTLTAIACTGRLFASTPDHLATISRYQEVIAMEALKNDLPPELLASIIYGHQRYQTKKRRFTDCFGSALGADLSLGLAQIRMSTAYENAGRNPESISPAEFKAFRTELMAPETNIMHQARELRLLLDRDNHYPGISAEELIHDPVIMALLMSEYRAGRSSTPGDASRLSANAFSDMLGFLENDIYVFDRPLTDITLIQSQVWEYLDYINCDSGMFNSSVCESWRLANAKPL